MNDFDFDRFFADDLRKGVPLAFVEADWENMAARLDAMERNKRRRRFLLMAFPVAASAALLLMAWGLWQMSGQVKSLQHELAQIRSASPNTLGQADTSTHRVSVIRYDTIYRTLVIQGGHWVAGQMPDSGRFENLKPASTIPYTNKLAGATSPTSTPHDSLTRTSNLVWNADSLNEQEKNLALLIPLDALSLLPISTPSITRSLPDHLDTLALPAVHAPSKRPLAAFMNRLRPHEIALGASGGVVWPQVRGAQSSPGFTGGLAGQVAFGRHIRLTGEFRWSKVWLRLKSSDQNTALLPPVPPPTMGDVLEYVQVRQPSWDYLLGLRYHLRPERRLQPYFTLAWAGATMLEQTLQYEFHNDATETETVVELPYTEQHVFRSRWQIGLGAEWRSGKRLAFGGELFWQNSIGSGGFLEGPRPGLKAQVFYFL